MLRILFRIALLSVSLAAAQTVGRHGKIVGCYFGAWSIYRDGYGKFDVPDIDPTLCTHGYYGFGDLNNQTWHYYVIDPWYDLGAEDCEPGECFYDSYRDFVKLKQRNPDFVPMLSIGGWNAGSGKFSVMAADPEKREMFISSLMPVVLQYGFGGVDFDWEYPGVLQGADVTMDKYNYNLLVQELSLELKKHGLLFTAAVSPNQKYAETAYDLDFMMDYFNFVNVMTYDYHGMWENSTGHNSPLYGRKEENFEDHPGYQFNVYDTLHYYLNKGVNPDQLVLGMPAYGRGWVLENPEEHGLYCSGITGIRKGPYTRTRGFLGYQEILQLNQNDTLPNFPEATIGGWVEVRDNCYKAPYYYNGPYWVGFDDPESLTWKVRLANFLDLAGVMIWSVDTDDFTGQYSNGVTYPLLRAAHDALYSGEKYDPRVDADTCASAPMCSDVSVECRRDQQRLPYPGDCRRYYVCHLRADDSYYTVPHSCGDWPFNPNTEECVQPELGEALICGDQ